MDKTIGPSVRPPGLVQPGQKKIFKGEMNFLGQVAMAIMGLKRLKGARKIDRIVVDLSAWKKLDTLKPFLEQIKELKNLQSFLLSYHFRDLKLGASLGADPATTLYIMGDPENIRALDKLVSEDPVEDAARLRRHSNLLGD